MSTLPDTITLKSGNKLEVHLPPFPDSLRLLKAVVNELKKVDIDLDKIDLSMDVAKLDPKTINVFKNGICQLVGSDEVEKALATCASRCLLKGQRVTMQSFDDPACREDYLAVAWEVTRANLTPFFKGLDLKFSMAKPPSPGASLE